MLERNNIYLGDSYKLIKQVADKSIDLIVIDPPYQIDGKPKSEESLNRTNNVITKSINRLNNELMDNHICDGIKEEIHHCYSDTQYAAGGSYFGSDGIFPFG